MTEPASTFDVLPTVFALAGAPLPTGRTLDGRDIRHYLSPALGPDSVPEFRYFYTGNRTLNAVRAGPWKLHVQLTSQTGENGGFAASEAEPLLFQVEHDVSERIDRAGEEVARIPALQSLLRDFRASIDSEGTFWDSK